MHFGLRCDAGFVARPLGGGLAAIGGLLSRLGGDAAASVVPLLAVMVPVLVFAAGATVDYLLLVQQRFELQTAADNAALAAAKELTVPDPQGNAVSRIDAMAAAVVQQRMQNARNLASPTLTTTFDSATNTVNVALAQATQPMFTAKLGVLPVSLSVQSMASLVGATNICILGLNPKGVATVTLTKNAMVTANGCAAYSDSTSNNGLISMNNALLKADLICTAGGKTGGKGNYDPDVILDCPAVADPLAERQPDPVGACDQTNTVILNKTATLSPGVYCGGLQVEGTSVVTLSPGTYVIKDGPFLVRDTASLSGEYVSFHLMGKKTAFAFLPNTSISLTASKDGALAGILFFEDHTSPTAGLHTISSQNAHVILGTIYLSHSIFFVDANEKVADQSAYTAIIADRVVLDAGPNLVLNADYSKTDVPVPAGIQGRSRSVRLMR